LKYLCKKLVFENTLDLCHELLLQWHVNGGWRTRFSAKPVKSSGSLLTLFGKLLKSITFMSPIIKHFVSNYFLKHQMINSSMFTLLISLSFGSNQSLQEVCRDTTPKSEDLTFVLLALYPYLNKQAKIQPNNHKKWHHCP
jgi:hypothetical protein